MSVKARRTSVPPGPGPEVELRPVRAPVPEGRDRWGWYGPAFIWIVASVGSGSVLFTPRVGSRYEYALLWAALLVMLFIWTVLREVGRYTLVTGRSILDGYSRLPGPRGWGVWVIFLPQLVASAVIVAGIAALVGSALMIALPGGHALYGVSAILVSCLLVISGRYVWVERVSTVMAALLVVAAFLTAAVARPDPAALAGGLVPGIPPDFDLRFVIPWLSFVVAGPAAVLWYSYWLIAREYGGGGRAEDGEGLAPGAHEARVGGWMRIVSTTAGIGVLGGGLVSVAFLILGVQLLGPLGVIPEGIEVARDLSRLLADVWGPAGFWLLILGIVIALWGSILANQDGFGRLYADASLLVLPRRWTAALARLAPDSPGIEEEPPEARVRRRLQNVYTVGALTLAPLVIFLVARDPVAILTVGGLLAAAHMPLVVFVTLYVNRTRLPRAYRPGAGTFAVTALAGVFYAAAALTYLAGLVLGGAG